MTMIINADDFGMFESANRGILYSLEQKLINSVSICVNYETSQVLTNILQYREQLLSIGLHVNVTEAYSLISNTKYPNSISLYSERRSYEFYCDEIESQIKKFKLIFSFLPEHLDCHQHYVYFDETAYRAYVKLSQIYQIPIRSPFVFAEKERLKNFFNRVKEMHGVRVPFSVEKIVSNIKRVSVDNNLLRSRYVNLSPEALGSNNEDSLEVVCHPQIESDGRLNIDLKVLENIIQRMKC